MNVRQDALIDTLFDSRYRIQRRIGVGGMARVYLAEDETLGRSVAIKILNNRYAEDDQFVERFLREASAAARLNHPNIVQVYDRGEADDTYYIAMEYVDGTTLKDVINSKGPLPSQEVIDFARQALNALRFAHRNGIVHRDVKPHNMMVDGEGRLKIADFGIARAGADQGLTEVGSIVGTAQYLSPEQAQGEVVSASSDLYSLGVVMFEMATGTVPYDGDSPVNIALKHVKDPIPVPHHRNPSVSGALEAIIIRALQKDPDIRYQTADEFMHDLDKAARGIVPAETAAITQVVSRAQNTAATTVSPAVPRTTMTPPPRPTDYDQGRSRQPEPKRKKWPWLLLLFLLLAVAAVAIWVTSSGGGIVVPDVSGKTVAEATTIIEAEGLDVVEETQEEPSEDFKKGLVVKTNPGEGEELDKGEDVTLVVSTGPDAVIVPSLVGLSQADATGKLEDLGLVVNAVQKPSEVEDKGLVIAQDPGVDQEVAPGSTVRINIGTGITTVDVPSVIGLTKNEARAKLEDAGLKVEVVEEDGTNKQNEVIDQAPTGSDKAKKGSTVVITVGSGYNTVPDVIGQTESSATTALEEAGYKVKVEYVLDPVAPADGEVAEQDPLSQTRYKLEFTVTITVHKP